MLFAAHDGTVFLYIFKNFNETLYKIVRVVTYIGKNKHMFSHTIFFPKIF